MKIQDGHITVLILLLFTCFVDVNIKIKSYNKYSSYWFYHVQ